MPPDTRLPPPPAGYTTRDVRLHDWRQTPIDLRIAITVELWMGPDSYWRAQTEHRCVMVRHPTAASACFLAVAAYLDWVDGIARSDDEAPHARPE